MPRFSLLDVLPTPPPPLHIVDVGAMLTEDEPYRPLVARGVARVTGFEPQPSQHERLRSARPGDTYLPHVIGDGGERVFHTCRFPGCSSLYEPDPGVIQRFYGLHAGPGGNFEVVGRQRVQTTRLDDVPDLAPCDFLKLDVQGAEFDVLSGAPAVLANVLVVQTEVEFVPLYRDQPLFGDVDGVLRRHHFMLHKLVDVSGRIYRPLDNPSNPAHPLSQILWADAVFIPNFDRLDALPPERLLALALIMHDVYGSADLCAHILDIVERKGGLPLRTLYLKRLDAAGDLAVSLVTVKNWTE